MKIMSFKEILKIIKEAGKKRETVEIYYPKTWRSKAGWREIEPYSIATDIPPEGEHLVVDKEEIKPGHILNAYTVASNKDHCDSFILGKIKSARPTGRSFQPRFNWKVEF